ncbi:MAG: hypothetical protein IKC76_05335 [Firmicutes bacterium]|nr:hypothetical protein [Bacillota bacterium]
MQYKSIVYFIVAALFIGSAWKMTGFLRWGLYAVGCVWLTLGLWKTRLEMSQEQKAKEQADRPDDETKYLDDGGDQ